MSRRIRLNRGESGEMLPVASFCMLAVTSVLALVIDLGADYVYKADLQRAVDAAALAGANYLPGSLETAEDVAEEFAIKNGIVDTDELLIEFTSTHVANDTIVVSVSRDVEQRFAGLVGIESVEVDARAAARIASPAGLDRFIPFGVLSSAVNPLQHGDALTLTYNSNDPTTGNSLAIALPETSGGSDFRDGIYYGSALPFCTVGQEHEGCPSVLSSEPGNMVGPLHQGFRDLLNDTSASCDDFNEVFVSGSEDSSQINIAPACNPFPPNNVTTSKRLALLPVIDNLCQGRCDVPIIRFTLFFTESVHCTSGTCEVMGRYAEDIRGFTNFRPGRYDPASAFSKAVLIE